MKKLLYLLLLSTLLISCSSDDDGNEEKKEPTQDYTSFVVNIQNTVSDNLILPNCIAGYKEDGKYYKLDNLGNLSKNKSSYEIKVGNKTIKEVYIFSDYNNVIRFDTVYILQTNKKNTFEIGRYTKGIPITDKKDPTQYPQ